MTAEAARYALQVRELREADLEAVVRIDALHTGERKPEYWGRVFGDFLGAETGAATCSARSAPSSSAPRRAAGSSRWRSTRNTRVAASARRSWERRGDGSAPPG